MKTLIVSLKVGKYELHAEMQLENELCLLKHSEPTEPILMEKDSLLHSASQTQAQSMLSHYSHKISRKAFSRTSALIRK